MTFLAHPGMPVDQGGTSPASELGMGVHGGTDETSVMLHLAPELVRHEHGAAPRTRQARRQHVRALRWAGQLRVAVERLPSRMGIIGDPTAATAERGARAVRGSVRSFCEALREISTFDFGR